MPAANFEDRELAAIYNSASSALYGMWTAVAGFPLPEHFTLLSQSLFRCCFLVYADNSNTGLPVNAARQHWQQLNSNLSDPFFWMRFNELWLDVRPGDNSENFPPLKLANGAAQAESLFSLIKHHAVQGNISPSAVLGAVHQAILDNEPLPDDPRILRQSAKKRKTHGAFYTPAALINFTLTKTLGSKKDEMLRILDPACGAGAFLSGAAKYLASAEPDSAKRRKRLCRIIMDCLYGVESDLPTVEAARLSLWIEAGDPDIPLGFLDSHIRCADFLNGYRAIAFSDTNGLDAYHQLGLASDGSFSWENLFPEIYNEDSCGFDAVVGNPPYVAAKNQNLRAYEAEWGIRGQSDLYILFIVALARNRLIRPGGRYGLVLPDPLLTRENAEPARKVFLEKMGLDAILHIRGLFKGAVVANAIVTGTAGKESENITCARIESLKQASEFSNEPEQTFYRSAFNIEADCFVRQQKMEMPYIVFSDPETLTLTLNTNGNKRILGTCVEPFACLGDFPNVQIFRGEEIGKSAIRSYEGDLPILLGGESIAPFKIDWKGHKIPASVVKKPLSGYLSAKILVQKSASRTIAAVDYPFAGHQGFVVPQSLYCISLPDEDDMFYIAALLNSEVIRTYVRNCFTGYKMLHPQVEIEDLKRIPIRLCSQVSSNEKTEALILEGAAAAISGNGCTYCRERIEANETGILRAILVLAARDSVFGGPFKTLASYTDVIIRALYGL